MVSLKNALWSPAALTVLTLLSGLASAETPKSIAVMDCEILDDTREYNTPELNEAQDKRLKLITEELKHELSERGLYTVFENSAVRAGMEAATSRETFYGCNGCESLERAVAMPRAREAYAASATVPETSIGSISRGENPIAEAS